MNPVLTLYFDGACHLLHCKTEDGRVLTGVAAFLEVWRVLPGYGLLRRTVSLPLVRPFAEAGYRVFALVRPLLPKRADGCPIDLVSRTAADSTTRSIR